MNKTATSEELSQLLANAEKGDLFLSTAANPGWRTKLIRLLTGSPYSHVGMITDPEKGLVTHSAWNRNGGGDIMQTEPLSSWNEHSNVQLFKVKGDVDRARALRVLEKIKKRSPTNTGLDKLKSLIPRPGASAQDIKSMILKAPGLTCANSVACAYPFLASNPMSATPGSIARSESLVPSLKSLASSLAKMK